MKDYLNIHDIYPYYRYPYRDKNSKSIFRPYIPLDKISNHKYKLSFTQWSIVVKTYIDVLGEKLMSGKPFKLPWTLGVLRLGRYRSSKVKPWHDGKVYKSWHTDRWKPTLIWFKKETARFNYKNIYRLELPRKVWNNINKSLLKDPSLIYKLPNTQRKFKHKVDHAI